MTPYIVHLKIWGIKIDLVLKLAKTSRIFTDLTSLFKHIKYGWSRKREYRKKGEDEHNKKIGERDKESIG